MKDSKGFSSQLSYAGDDAQAAKELLKNLGRTDQYSTGIVGLDRYLFGGYGSREMWDIILIHGPYGSGKSTFALSLLASPIKQGHKVGIMALEDDTRTLDKRLAIALDDLTFSTAAFTQHAVRKLPPSSLDSDWTLDDLATEIEKWFTDKTYGVDIILLDHLQMAFDYAEIDKTIGEYNSQKRFMNRLNRIMKRTSNKTLILVAQQNAEGLLAGSRAIRYAGSTMLKLDWLKNGDKNIRTLLLEKTRETPQRDYVYMLELRNQRFYASPIQPNAAKEGPKF